jgi:hypothetical protein
VELLLEKKHRYICDVTASGEIMRQGCPDVKSAIDAAKLALDSAGVQLLTINASGFLFPHVYLILS